MTLLVNVYRYEESGEMIILEPNNHSEELAGFESYRNTFYGSQVAKSLGLQLLPTLANTNLYVESQDLINLQLEAELILQNMFLFIGIDAETIQFRIHNILKAIAQAREIGGGVVIW
jgi:hypothetical protein